MSGICEEKPSVLVISPVQVEYLKMQHPTNYKNLCRMMESGEAELRIPTQCQENDEYQRFKDGKQEGTPIPLYERGS